MTNRPDQPGRDALLSEESLLALLEGELSETRQREVLAALNQRPELFARVRGMARDRALLTDLCDVEAPPEVIEAVNATLERAALFDAPDSFSDLPPAPIAMPRPRSGRNLSRMLAMAAGVALLAGAAGFWALTRPGNTRTAAPAIGPLAVNKTDSIVAPPPERAATPPEAGEATRTAPLALATPNDEPAGANSLKTGGTPTEPVAPAAVDAPRTAAPASEPVTVLASAPITNERAVELACQGRLAVRVRSRSIGETIDSMDAIASRAGDRSWRLCRANEPRQDAAQAGVAQLARNDTARAAREKQEGAVASATPGFGDVRVSESRQDRKAVGEPHPYFASVALTPEALGSLRNAIESSTDARVVFEEIEGPVQPASTIDESEPLWWEDSPTRWVPWTDVFVVVEG